MKTADFNYNLPKKLIAQQPAVPRDSSRLLVYNKSQDKIIHDKFFNLVKYLKPNDVLVFNNTQVFPARLILNKKTGGKVEVFLLQNLGKNKWECLCKNLGKARELYFKNKKIGEVSKAEKNWQIKFNLTQKEFNKFLNQHGQTPLPPYIKTQDSKKIREQYQTVFAQHSGSVAAPTAGLHFTKKLLKKLNKFGVQQEFITLHVGLGTFAPIKTKNIQEHKLHAEYLILDQATCDRLNQAKQHGRRVIAVGTTSLRALESATRQGKLQPIHDWINLFVCPGYKFKFINGLITNFHLPQSSLLVLVSALVGHKKILKIYQQAIKKKYRFYSFGDAMFIF